MTKLNWFLQVVVVPILIFIFMMWYTSTALSSSERPPLTWQEQLETNTDLLRVAQCESGLNPKAFNPKDSDGEPKYSILQFDADTWIKWTKDINTEQGYAKWDIWSPDDQIKVGLWAFSKGYQYHWGCK